MENSCLVLIHLDPFISISGFWEKVGSVCFPMFSSWCRVGFYVSIINRDIFQIEKKWFCAFWHKQTKTWYLVNMIFQTGCRFFMSNIHLYLLTLWTWALCNPLPGFCQNWAIYWLLNRSSEMAAVSWYAVAGKEHLFSKQIFTGDLPPAHKWCSTWF